MLFFQKWKKNTFEYKFLKDVQNTIKDSEKYDIYFGFDFGFSKGINIYYGSKKDSKYAYKIYELFKKENLNIRLLTNIEENYDVIVLFGYINLEKEKKYIKNKTHQILKALSLF